MTLSAKETGLAKDDLFEFGVSYDNPEQKVDLSRIEFYNPVKDYSLLGVSTERAVNRANATGAIGSLGLLKVFLDMQEVGVHVIPPQLRGKTIIFPLTGVALGPGCQLFPLLIWNNTEERWTLRWNKPYESIGRDECVAFRPKQ